MKLMLVSCCGGCNFIFNDCLALDLSHTQNIGQMLRTHFTHSQFIIVSLKEDMFKNANVLFQTKFVDGVSTVSRTKH
jgi:structural maintenance of chromosome 2